MPMFLKRSVRAQLEFDASVYTANIMAWGNKDARILFIADKTHQNPKFTQKVARRLATQKEIF